MRFGKRSLGVIAAVCATALLLAACGGGGGVVKEAAPPSKPVVTADLVSSAVNQDAPPCVQRSQYLRGDHVVFRARVINPRTNEPMSTDQIKSVVVNIPGSKPLPMTFGAHPDPQEATDHFWSVAWPIPSSYPTGSVDFTITATTSSGLVGVYKPFNVEPSSLQVVDSLPTVPPAGQS